jgi:glutathione-regulated potassium-efflux system ancillary protein KefG
MSRSRVLVLFAHPALEKSRVNRHLLAAARDLDGVHVHDLYEAYPDFHVDVGREQALLVDHDVIVLQHPFFWYSAPSLVKEWFDLVLEHGWAYGRNGTALHGKRLLSAVTTGGPERAYGQEGRNRFTVRQLLAPVEQTAVLCGMDYLPPFIVHGTHTITPDEITGHASDYRRILEGLRDGSLDLTRADAHRLNHDRAIFGET